MSTDKHMLNLFRERDTEWLRWHQEQIREIERRGADWHREQVEALKRKDYRKELRLVERFLEKFPALVSGRVLYVLCTRYKLGEIVSQGGYEKCRKCLVERIRRLWPRSGSVQCLFTKRTLDSLKEVGS